MTINSDKPMRSFEGKKSSQGVLEKIEENETINMNRPIGSPKGRIQLVRYGQTERPNTEGYLNMALGDLEAS